MCNKSKKTILIIDDRQPEKTVLTSILDRLGYTVLTFEDSVNLKENMENKPNLAILNSSLKEVNEMALSYGCSECRVLLLDPAPKTAPDFSGFVDVTEHILRGINVKVPEIIMIVNDFISPFSKVISRQPRIAGGYDIEVKSDQIQHGQIFNISSTGAFIELVHPPVKGTELKLIFSLPGNENPYEIKSQVTWNVSPDESSTMRSPPGCGVRFLSIDEKQKAYLEKFVISGGKL
jgi:CheY-like chemotaxis protein